MVRGYRRLLTQFPSAAGSLDLWALHRFLKTNLNKDDVAALFDLPANAPELSAIAQNLSLPHNARVHEVLGEGNWWHQIPELLPDPALRAKFLQDISGNANFAAALKESPALVGAWEAVWQSPKILRTNLDVLGSMHKLIHHNLLQNIGGATGGQLANIHKYTALGDYLNQPFRAPMANALEIPNLVLSEFEYQSYRAIVEGLQALRQTSRLYTGIVLRGRPLSDADYMRLFGAGSPQNIPIKGFVSTTRNREVAEAFASMGSFIGLKYRMVWRIKSKNGVDINDLSDWGANLGEIYHPNAQPPVIRNQQEILLEEGYYKKLSSPRPILENGVPKIEVDADGNQIFWMEIDLEELGIPLRQITRQ